jgi:hypothetical protein
MSVDDGEIRTIRQISVAEIARLYAMPSILVDENRPTWPEKPKPWRKRDAVLVAASVLVGIAHGYATRAYARLGRGLR